MKSIMLAVFVMAVSVLYGQSASAVGLKLAPLEYRVVLKKDEVQRGFVDISNPSSLPVTVAIDVQAFKQINDDGGLAFYDDTSIASAIKPEKKRLDLDSRQAVRLYFSVDGRLLPKGDVYGAIFFKTEPKRERSGVGQSVRVGTLLSIINQNPSERKAEITGASLPLVQLSDTVEGTYTVKNTGASGNGFYPLVNVSAWPGTAKKDIESSLVFGGRERTNDMNLTLGYGIHRIDVSYGESVQSRWVVTLAPWMVITGLLIIVVIGIELFLLRRRRNAHRTAARKSTATS